MGGTWRRGAPVIALAGFLAVLSATAPAAGAQDGRAQFDIRVFTRIGQPGQPEAIAIAPDSTVYVGTNQQQRGDSDAPSKVFAFDSSGKPLREYVVEGQNLGEPHGIQGLALDASGVLYALDRAARPRVLTIDPRTGAQRDYAEFRDVPSCSQSGRTSDCSATMGDMPSGPNTATFGPDGSLYVTDIDQALIWRVPRGGGDPEVFFTDERLENVFGPNGIQMLSDGRTLLFAVTAQGPAAGDPTVGRLFRLPLGPDGRPGQLQGFYESRPLDGPDGFAVSESGRVFLALAGASQIVVVSAEGQEVTRFPDPAANRDMDPPVDGPASVAFLGDRALVTNQSFPAGNPDHWAVLDIFAGERGMPLFRPDVSGAGGSGSGSSRPSLKLTYRRGRDGRGRRCAAGRVRASLRGDVSAVRAATFRWDRRRVVRDRRAPFRAIVFRRPRRGARSGAHRVRATAELAGSGSTVRSARVRTCG